LPSKVCGNCKKVCSKQNTIKKSLKKQNKRAIVEEEKVIFLFLFTGTLKGTAY